MFENDITDERQRNIRLRWSHVVELCAQLAEDPRLATSGSSDHDAVGTRVVENRACFVRRIDIAVGDDGNANRLFDLADRVVLRMAGKTARARSAVHC